MARIKICGIRRDEDIDFVNALKPDYIGFILSAGYRRSINADVAKKLKARLSQDIKTVGVFVNEDEEYINSLVKSNVIDIVQLHGDESVSYCQKINAPLIKVLKPDFFDKTSLYESVADYLMFDSGTGSGSTFDWSEIPDVKKPFFLAGGLDKSNLSYAIEKVKPFAVDMSSCVETNGVKDYDKIKEIIEIVRSTQ